MPPPTASARCLGVPSASLLRGLLGRVPPTLSPAASRGVRVVTSEHHRGIGAAVAGCLVGVGRERCRVQLARRLGRGHPAPTRSQPPSAPRPPPSPPGLDRTVATLEPGVPAWPARSSMPHRTWWRPAPPVIEYRRPDLVHRPPRASPARGRPPHAHRRRRSAPQGRRRRTHSLPPSWLPARRVGHSRSVLPVGDLHGTAQPGGPALPATPKSRRSLAS
jgi:hypothetical protein